MKQAFATPTAGSGKTALVHGVPFASVFWVNDAPAPYAIVLVPVNVQSPFSGAQNVDPAGPFVTGPAEQDLAKPKSGSPKTSLVHAVPPVNVLYVKMPLAPKATEAVPVNEQVAFSAAQSVKPGGVFARPGLTATV